MCKDWRFGGFSARPPHAKSRNGQRADRHAGDEGNPRSRRRRAGTGAAGERHLSGASIPPGWWRVKFPDVIRRKLIGRMAGILEPARLTWGALALHNLRKIGRAHV